ncbi:MAG: hypothetical protein P8Z79_24730, partial [Sedimentisphaerales bacterium]
MPQSFGDRRLFPYDGPQVAKSFQVSRVHIRNNGDVRLGDARQISYFTGMIAAKLRDDNLHTGVCAEQSQRNSYRVVE